MKHLLIAMLSVFMVLACNEKPKEIVEDDIPKEEEQQPPKPQPCYDSTYFDTTLPMKEHDLIYFTVMLPEGGFSENGTVGTYEQHPGGKFGFGCDTFKFGYGPYFEKAYSVKPSKYTVSLEKEQRDNYLMAIKHDENSTGKKYLSLILTRNDTVNVATSVTDYHYDYYINKVIETIELK